MLASWTLLTICQNVITPPPFQGDRSDRPNSIIALLRLLNFCGHNSTLKIQNSPSGSEFHPCWEHLLNKSSLLKFMPASGWNVHSDKQQYHRYWIINVFQICFRNILSFMLPGCHDRSTPTWDTSFATPIIFPSSFTHWLPTFQASSHFLKLKHIRCKDAKNAMKDFLAFQTF